MRSSSYAGLVVALVACGKGGGGSGVPAGPGSGSAVVTYKPGVRVLERDEGLAAVVGTSTDGWTLMFDGHAPKLQGLKAGDVIVFKGLTARKVLAVEAQPGDEIAALTQSVTLGDALQQGRIDVHAPIRFSRPHASLWDLLEGTAYADGPSAGGAKGLTVKGKYKGWDATVTGSIGDGRADLDIQLTRSEGGFKALITGKGYIADFDMTSAMSMNASNIDHIQFFFRSLHGQMTFTWSVAKESPGGETGKAKFNLPGAIEIPLYQYLDGFPLFLEIGGAVLIEPAITGGSEMTKGSFHVNFGGSAGFEIKGGAVDSGDSKMDGDTDMDSLEAVSPAAPLGMVVAFAAPRFELTFGLGKVFKDTAIKEAAEKVDAIADNLIRNLLGEDGLAKWKESIGGFSLGQAVDDVLKSGANAWIQLQTSTGMTASGAMVVVPCRKSEIHIAVTAGAGAQVLGAQVGDKVTTIFKKDWARVEPPNLKVCQ